MLTPPPSSLFVGMFPVAATKASTDATRCSSHKSVTCVVKASFVKSAPFSFTTFAWLALVLLVLVLVLPVLLLLLLLLLLVLLVLLVVFSTRAVLTTVMST